jgi:hypothetical protein
MERVCGDVHDKCTRNHKRKRLSDVIQDVEQHMEENGPWKDKLSQHYKASEVTEAVEAIAAEKPPRLPRECTNLVWPDLA